MNADILDTLRDCVKSWRYRSGGDDLLQSTVEKMLEGERRGAVVRNLKGWASTVLRNLAVDKHREESRFVLSEETVLLAPDEENYPEFIEDSIDKRNAYRLMMAILPRDEEGQILRKVLRSAAEGLGIKEIAKALKFSKPFVEKKLLYLERFIQVADKACQRGSGIISERQRLILVNIKRGKMGKDIARLLSISEALVTRELDSVRKILTELMQGPWDDGGGGLRKRRRKLLAQHVPMSTSQPHEEEGPVLRGFTSSVEPHDGSRFVSFIRQKISNLGGGRSTSTNCERFAMHCRTGMDVSVARSLLELPAFQEMKGGANDAIVDFADGGHCHAIGLLIVRRRRKRLARFLLRDFNKNWRRGRRVSNNIREVGH